MTSLSGHESGTLRLRETRRPAGIPGDRIQGGPMPVIVVTRLRLRDPALLTVTLGEYERPPTCETAGPCT